MKKLLLLVTALVIVAATLPGCWRKKADSNTCTTKCCQKIEDRKSGPMQNLTEEDMKLTEDKAEDK